jgi:hypothetical protein
MKRSIAIALAGALLLGLTVLAQQAISQATSPQARFAVGLVTVGTGGFTNVKFVKHGGACRDVNINLNTGIAPGPVNCLLPLPAGSGRPDTVVVEGVSPIGGTVGTRPFQHIADSWTEDGFRLRLADFNGAVTAGTRVRITYRATTDPDGYCDANICS